MRCQQGADENGYYTFPDGFSVIAFSWWERGSQKKRLTEKGKVKQRKGAGGVLGSKGVETKGGFYFLHKEIDQTY